jgi:membrane-bound ClpP family serine protease
LLKIFKSHFIRAVEQVKFIIYPDLQINKEVNMRKLVYTALFLGILLVAVTAGGCKATEISEITTNFDKYEGEEVSIKGTVGETIWISVAEKGAFQVGDGSGNIWVVSSQPPPQQGETVRVTGTAQSAFSIGDNSLGQVIVESKRN